MARRVRSDLRVGHVVGIALVSAAALAASISEAAVWPVIVVAVVAVTVGLSRETGTVFAFGVGLIGVGAVLLTTLMLTSALSLPITASVAVAMTLICAISGLMLSRGSAWTPSRTAIASLVPAVLGCAAFPALAALSAAHLGARSLSWVMRGDSALFHIASRQVLADSGIAVGPQANPVPLPSALLALAIAPGRREIAPGRLLEHDLVGLAVLWVGMIALSALLSGVIAGRLVHRAGGSSAATAIAAGTGSLFSLSWLFTGYPVLYGFLGAQVALVIVLASVLVAVESRRPALTIAVLAAACVLLLATWTPLALVPTALAGVSAGEAWRSGALRRMGRRQIGVVIAAIVLAMAYVAIATVPGLLAGRGTQLSDSGASAELFPPWRVPLISVLLITVAAITPRATRSRNLTIAIGLVVAAVASLGALLAITHFAWTYYPRKMAWLVSLPLVVAGLGMAIAALDGLSQRAKRVTRGAQAIVALGFIAFVGAIPATPGIFDSGDLTRRVLNGGVMVEGDEVADVLLRNADAENPQVLWRTEEPGESMITFWLLMSWAAPGPSGSGLVTLAYAPDSHGDVERLCQLAKQTGPGLLVHTSDLSLEPEAEARCGDLGMRFITAW